MFFINKTTQFAVPFVTRNKPYPVKDVLDKKKKEKLITLDNVNFFYRTLRNGPPYLPMQKKNLFAMIRQLGLPTLVIY